jgi:hypothetical protein
MAISNIGIPRQRVPFRGYIYRLMENNGIPNPPGGQTNEEVWGYFIVEMSKKASSTIIANLSDTGGSLVSSLTATLAGNTFTVNKKDTNIGTGVSVDTAFPIIAGTNVVFSGSMATGLNISVPSIGTTTKFFSTENGAGNVGDTLTLTISDTTPFVVGDTLAIGSVVYLQNNYTVEVHTMDIPTDSYEGIVIEARHENEQSDWDETDTTSDAYIKNKPDFNTLSTNVTNIMSELGDITGQFGDGYFVKELVANVDAVSKTIEVVKTHVSIDPADPTMTYPITFQIGSSLTMVATVDVSGNPVVTVDVDTSSPTSPISTIINDISTINTNITTIQGDISTIEGDIVTIQTDISGIQADLSNKVDKVAGKGLSTEDYTTAEKTKLASVEPGAQVNVQSDWNQTNPTADDYIKNKPSSLTTTWGTISGTLSNQTDLQAALNDKVDKIGFGDGYFVKELVANVDASVKTIEVIKTHKSIDPSAPTMVYPLKLQVGSGLSMAATVDVSGNPIVTVDVDTTAPGSPIANIINNITSITSELNNITTQFGDGYFVKELTATVNDVANEIIVTKTHTSIDPSDPTMTYPITFKTGTGLDLVASVDSGGHPVVTLNSTSSTNTTYWRTTNTPIGIIVGSVLTDNFSALTKISGGHTVVTEQDHIYGVDSSGNSFESLVTGVTGTTATSQVISINVVPSATWGGITGNIMTQPEFTPFGDGYIVKELVANVDVPSKSIRIVKTHTSLIPSNPTMTYPMTITAGAGLSMAASVDISGNPIVTLSSLAQSSNRMRFVGNGTTNTITLSSTINATGADVYVNGLLLDESEYTLTNTVFTFGGLWILDSDDVVIIKWYN